MNSLLISEIARDYKVLHITGSLKLTKHTCLHTVRDRGGWYQRETERYLRERRRERERGLNSERETFTEVNQQLLITQTTNTTVRVTHKHTLFDRD